MLNRAHDLLTSQWWLDDILSSILSFLTQVMCNLHTYYSCISRSVLSGNKIRRGVCVNPLCTPFNPHWALVPVNELWPTTWLWSSTQGVSELKPHTSWVISALSSKCREPATCCSGRLRPHLNDAFTCKTNPPWNTHQPQIGFNIWPMHHCST